MEIICDALRQLESADVCLVVCYISNMYILTYKSKLSISFLIYIHLHTQTYTRFFHDR